MHDEFITIKIHEVDDEGENSIFCLDENIIMSSCIYLFILFFLRLRIFSTREEGEGEPDEAPSSELRHH